MSFLLVNISVNTLKGKEFLFAPPDVQYIHMKLDLVGDPGTKITVMGNFRRMIQVVPDTGHAAMKLPKKGRTSVRVTANNTVSASLTYYGWKTNDGTIPLLPVSSLSTKYFIVTRKCRKPHGHKWTWSSFVITALRDNTSIKVTFGSLTAKCDLSISQPNIMVIEKTLEKHEVYGVYCNSDMTGTMIESSAPVAVISGTGGASVPDNGVDSIDSVFAMMHPVEMYGQEYVLHGLDQAPLVYRTVAASDNTVVTWGTNTKTFNQGDFMDIDTATSGEHCLRSTKPVLVVVFYKSGTTNPWNGTDYGDPFMATVPATHQYASSYNIPYRRRSLASNYRARLMLIIRSCDVERLLNSSTLGVNYIKRSPVLCSTYNIFTFVPRKMEEEYTKLTSKHGLPKDTNVFSMNLTFNYGLFFYGLGYRAGCAFYGTSAGKHIINILYIYISFKMRYIYLTHYVSSRSGYVFNSLGK